MSLCVCVCVCVGTNKHTIAQIKDAIRDGLRSVKNVLESKRILPGGGAVEMLCARRLRERKTEVSGKARLGVEAFAEALLVIPKMLAANSGFDQQDVIIKLEVCTLPLISPSSSSESRTM